MLFRTLCFLHVEFAFSMALCLWVLTCVYCGYSLCVCCVALCVVCCVCIGLCAVLLMQDVVCVMRCDV